MPRPSDDASRFMLNATTHAISPVTPTIPKVEFPFRCANTHNSIRLILTKPCFLRLAQHSFTNVVKEMSNNDEREGNRV
jgi:hypothetical protein